MKKLSVVFFCLNFFMLIISVHAETKERSTKAPIPEQTSQPASKNLPTKKKSTKAPSPKQVTNQPVTKDLPTSTPNSSEPTKPAAAQVNALPKVAKKLNVVTTLAVIASIAKEIGGDRVNTYSLTYPAEDPHFVKEKPSFRSSVGDADLFLQIGRGLELWVPQVLSSVANPKLSSSGVVSVSQGFLSLEAPTELSRDKGDIHPQGNPHMWLSPLGGLKIAENIRDALIKLDATSRDVYEKNFAEFKQKLSIALFGDELVKSSASVDFLWRLYQAKTLKNYLVNKKKTAGGWMQLSSQIDYPFINYHRVWSYLINELDLKYFGSIEEKSGTEPPPKYVNQLIKNANENHVKHVFDARYYVGFSSLINRVATQINGRARFIDADCLANETFVAMMDRIIKELVQFKTFSTNTKS